MIQRIQTIYLLLAALVLGLLYIPLSIGTSAPSSEGIYADGVFNLYDNQVFLGLNLVPLLDYFTAIFLFGNRKIQLLVTSIGSLFSSVLAGLYTYMVLNHSAQIAAGIAMPLLALLFGYLAFRNIKKDEEIVRSADRLR